MTHAAPVVGVEHLADHMVLLSVDLAATPLPHAYKHVGQYVTLRTEASPPGYFAIATPPGAPVFEFLIRIEPHKPKTAELGKLKAGDQVLVGEVQGEGYPLHKQYGRDLLLVASGTGIAPIRALLGEIKPLRDKFGAVTLVYGAANRRSLAFAGEQAAWESMGVKLVPVLSRAAQAWAGARGYVQDLVADLPIAPARTTAFLCGHKEMADSVAAILRERGVPAECIFEN